MSSDVASWKKPNVNCFKDMTLDHLVSIPLQPGFVPHD